MYLVIDIGGTYTKYGYYNQDGQCSFHEQFPTIKTNIHQFYEKIQSLIQPDTQAITLSMPGLIDSNQGIVHDITLLPFLKEHHIKEELEKLFQLPVTIENDAKCAALGEIWKGNLQNIRNGLFLVLGSGIGGTLILNHNIMSSSHYKIGEIGSVLMPLDMNYQKMTNFGASCNANILIEKVSQAIGCLKDGHTVFEKIKTNQKAQHIFRQYCRKIAFMIYNLDYILDLDVVCIGGGISQQSILIETIQEEFILLRNQYKEDQHAPIIVSCLYHNKANLLGALYHLLQTIQ